MKPMYTNRDDPHLNFAGLSQDCVEFRNTRPRFRARFCVYSLITVDLKTRAEQDISIKERGNSLAYQKFCIVVKATTGLLNTFEGNHMSNTFSILWTNGRIPY
ncbi:uncharacterized protein LOC131938049 [Physella acuta]|uniref:uncharacterized protein LOC131938049 n=1 Tax=Physella acuta TaxID=109671 RepID=UPI0027DB524D|nr:uncharacterized protein LOC131938049 [Physella acuta]